MDEKFQTSQQKAGEHHKPEGKGEGAVTLTEPDNGGGKGNFTATSQQIRGEHHTPES